MTIVTSVMGPLSSCMKRHASAAADACSKIDECKDMMASLEKCMTTGSLSSCVAAAKQTTNLEFADLVTGFANSPCMKGDVRSLARSLLGFGRRLAVGGVVAVPMAATSAGNTGGATFSVASSSSAATSAPGPSSLSLNSASTASTASKGMSGGAVAGVAVGCAAVVGLVVAGVMYKRKDGPRGFVRGSDAGLKPGARDDNTDVL